MKKVSKLDQAAKYVLCFDNIFYLADSQNLTGVNLTEDTKQARIFAHGFDNPEDKKEIWSLSLQRLMNSKLVNFEVKNI